MPMRPLVPSRRIGIRLSDSMPNRASQIAKDEGFLHQHGPTYTPPSGDQA